MTARTLRPGVVILSLALLAVVGAGPVHAAQPFSEPFVDGGSEDIDCGSYIVTLERTYAGIATVFFDQRGDAVRLQFTSRLEGSISRDGRTIALTGAAIVVIDFVRETFTFDGTTLIGTEKGGVAIQDSGRFQLDFEDNILQLAGPHDAIELGADAFCRALA